MSRIVLSLPSLAALILYALTLRENVFSDGLQLETMVRAGPAPYHNALYLPLGWLVWKLLSLFGEVGVWTALQVLSVLAGAGSVALVTALLRRAGQERLPAACWSLVFALTPGVWFFSTVVETHALELCAACAATLLALVAREAAPRRALALVCAGAALAVLAHLVNLFLVPVLILLARGEGPDRGLVIWGRRALVQLGALVLVLGVLGLGVMGAAQLLDTQRAGQSPARFLGLLVEIMGEKLTGGGALGLDEVGAFLGAELLAPAGCLLVGPLLLLVVPGARRRPLAAAAWLGALPSLLVIPQGGIREAGAYFLPLYPVLLLCLAEALRPRPRRAAAGLALVLALVQVSLGWRALERFDRAPEVRAWARQVGQVCEPGGHLLTTSLPRYHAAVHLQRELAVIDLLRLFEMQPRARWDGLVQDQLGQASQALAEGRAVYLDALLLGGEGTHPGLVRFAERVLSYPVDLEPLPAGEPVVYRVWPPR